MAGKARKSIRELSPIDVYRHLPGTNCGDCGDQNCMAFATRVVNGEILLDACLPLRTPSYAAAFRELSDLLAPAVRAVTIGTGPRAVTIGGKHVLHRHEFTYHNPPPVAIDVSDDMDAAALAAKVGQIHAFSYVYIGRQLTLDMIAVRSVTGDPDRFRVTVEHVAGLTDLPLILCSLEPEVLEAGLIAVPDRRPLLYAATEQNWQAMADLALRYSCPLALAAPGDLPLLRSLSRTLGECGISDLVLDPGTIADDGLSGTIHRFMAVRSSATREQDALFGYPLLGTPISVWSGEELSPEVNRWKEACLASMLITRYADLLILHSLDGWVLLPQLIWRFGLYTDPRKPVSVEPGVKLFGTPDRSSPVLVTTNYALTYFTVESDLKAANIDCFLVVIDTGGLSVESAVAGRYLTAEKIAAALRDYTIGALVDHRHIVIPGLAARLSGETEEATGWHVLVGPRDSSGIGQMLRESWPPDNPE
jgi:acetyl-CoA decarbonylase/synthase complex subunit gamma